MGNILAYNIKALVMDPDLLVQYINDSLSNRFIIYLYTQLIYL